MTGTSPFTPASVAGPTVQLPHGIGRFVSLRSLRVRLVLAVLVIDALVATATGAVIVLKARTAIRLEIASSMQLAEMLVADTIRLLKDAPTPVLLKSLDLHVQQLRHVRITVYDVDGHAVEGSLDPHLQAVQAGGAPEAPAWFATLVSPAVLTKTFPVTVDGQRLSAVAVRSEPGDEAGEAWVYADNILLAMMLLNLPILAILFPLFGRLLAPLTRLGLGLRTIENKTYDVRLPPPSLIELASITHAFNRMAESLASAQIANRQLHRQLLSAQDDERRRTALELHDEVGPCLFALEANATSISNITRAAEDARLRERADDLVALVARVQRINRRVLDRLRPLSLGRMSLADSLAKVLLDFEGSETRLMVDPPSASWRRSYGRLLDLTIYRCAQEGLTNAFRHAGATRVALRMEDLRIDGGDTILLRIEDDGHGLRLPMRLGQGLNGMRERVEALNGTLDLRSSSSGTILSVRLPIDPADSPHGARRERAAGSMEAAASP